jgi:hypothetical protein
VQRRDGRDAQGPGEVEDAFAILTAPEAVLVLDRYDVDAVAQRAGGPQVVRGLVLADPVMDLRWIERRLLGGVQDGDLGATGCRRQVVGEGRDAAASRRVGRNEGGLDDQRDPLERYAPLARSVGD